MYTMTYYSATKKKEIMPYSATWMDQAIIIQKWQKLEKRWMYDFIYMWNLKKRIQMNLFVKQKQTHRHRKQTCDY